MEEEDREDDLRDGGGGGGAWLDVFFLGIFISESSILFFGCDFCGFGGKLVVILTS